MLTIDLKTTLSGHQNPVFTIENSQKKGILFSAGNDKGVVEWSVKTDSFIKVMFPVKTSVYALHCPEDFPLLLAGERSGQVNVFDFEAQKITAVLTHHKLPVFDIKSVRSKNELLVSSEDGSVSVWDLKTLKHLYSFQVSKETVRVMAVSKDEKTVAFGCKDSTIRVYRLDDYSQIHELDPHTMPVTSLQYSPDGSQLISGSRDAHLKVWDTAGYTELQSIPAHLFAIYSIAYHPELPYLATCSRDKTIKIWDAETLQLRKTISIEKGYDSHRLSVNKLIWSNYDQTLITAGDDKEIKVWKVSLEI